MNTESPAQLELAAHHTALATLDAEEQAIRANIARAEAIKAPIAALQERRTALHATLAQHIAAGLDGSARPDQDADELRQQLADVELELASQQVQAQGADVALGRLRAQMESVNQRRTAEMERRKTLQRAQADELLAAVAESAEATVAPFIALYVEMGAVAAARDYLKLPSESWCADVFGKTKLKLPAPFGIKAFDAFAAERDLRPQIEARAQEILRGLGVEVRR